MTVIAMKNKANRARNPMRCMMTPLRNLACARHHPLWVSRAAYQDDSDGKGDVIEEKDRLRALLLSARPAAGSLADPSAALCRRLAQLPELAAAATVAGYAATPRELSVDGILRALLTRGVVVCLPWVEQSTLGLARVVDLDTDLEPGWRGLREPRRVGRVAVEPSWVDAVLVPALAFDRHGNRLGQGGGHFDRLLAQLRGDAIVIGVARDAAIIDAVPTEAHDRPVHLIATPTKTLRASA
jgi:5-formyltetrahydrofolate cyclo-ligase